MIVLIVTVRRGGGGGVQFDAHRQEESLAYGCINLFMSPDHFFLFCRFVATTPAVEGHVGGPCVCSTT